MARLTVGDPVRVVNDERFGGQTGFVERIHAQMVQVRLHCGGLAVFWSDQVIPILEARRERDV